MMQVFDTLLIHPIINLLVAIYHLVSLVGLPFAFGFSIILMTVVIRLIIYPLTASQLRASHKMQKVSPHLAKLKEKHKGDMKALQQATMDLYKEHGVNPAAGCLLALVQLPILLALYSVFQNLISKKPEDLVKYINDIVYTPGLRIQEAWDMHFFGLPLHQTPEQLFNALGFLVLLIPLSTAVLQFFQSKMMFPTQPKDESAPKSTESDFAKAMQTQTLYILPIFLAVASWKFALGLTLYWNTFAIFGMIQQYLIQREHKEEKPAPKVSLPALPKATKQLPKGRKK